MSHVAYALIAGLGFAFASIMGMFGIRVSNHLRLGSVAVAAGILVAITIADIYPEAVALGGSARAAFAFAAGFLVLFLIEALTNAHVHHHDPHDGHDHSHEHLAHHHQFVPFALGLGLHNLADGLAIGASAELSGSAAAGVTLGVLIHQLPVGISCAAVLHAMHVPRKHLIRTAALLGAVIPIGAAVVAATGHLDHTQLSVLFGAAAGALMYVATGHLLPEVQSEESKRALACTFAVTLVASVFFFGVLVPG
ncbi:MAG: Zinc transporter ZupT [Thermoleophilia bacterium]|nr:Zinc transporter ZupT [Thermoleophilia bacterium]